MKSTTVKAKEMSDDELKAEGLRLRRQIPKEQALFDAIKREQRHRSDKALKQAAHKEAGAP